MPGMLCPLKNRLLIDFDLNVPINCHADAPSGLPRCTVVCGTSVSRERRTHSVQPDARFFRLNYRFQPGRRASSRKLLEPAGASNAAGRNPVMRTFRRTPRVAYAMTSRARTGE